MRERCVLCIPMFPLGEARTLHVCCAAVDACALRHQQLVPAHPTARPAACKRLSLTMNRVRIILEASIRAQTHERVFWRAGRHFVISTFFFVFWGGARYSSTATTPVSAVSDLSTYMHSIDRVDRPHASTNAQPSPHPAVLEELLD